MSTLRMTTSFTTKREENYMMCGICASNPVFYTTRQYTEHVRRFHPRTSTSALTDREIHMYSLHGRQPETVAGNNIGNISPSILREGFQRTEEILASYQRQQSLGETIFQTNTASDVHASSDHTRNVPNSRIDGLAADIRAVQLDVSKIKEEAAAQRKGFERMQDEATAKSTKMKSLEEQLIELQKDFRRVDEALAAKIEESDHVKSASSQKFGETLFVQGEQRLDEKAVIKIQNNNNSLEIEKLEKLLTEKAKEIAALNCEKADFENDCRVFFHKMEEDYMTLEKSYEAVKEELQSKTKELVNLKRTREAQCSEMAVLRVQLNEEAENSSALIKNLKKELLMKEKSISDLEQDRLHHNDKMDELSDMITLNYNSYRSECDELKQKLNVSSMKNTELSETISVHEKQINDLESLYRKSQKEKDEVKKDLGTAKVSIKSKEETIGELRLQIKTLSESLSEKDRLLQNMVKESEQTTNSSQLSINNKERQICELTSEVTEERQKRDKLTTELRDMSLKNSKLEEGNGDLKSEIDSKNQELEEKAKELEDLQMLLDSRIKDDAELKFQFETNLTSKINEINEQNQELEEKAKELEDLQKLLDKSIKKNRILQTLIQGRTKDEEDLKLQFETDLTSKINEINELKRVLRDHKEAFSTEGNKLADLQNLLDCRNKDEADLKLRFESDLSLKDNEINELKRMLQEQKKTSSIEGNKLADLQNLLDCRSKDEADLKLRFESDLSLKDNEINELKRMLQEQKETSQKPADNQLCTTIDTDMNPTDENVTCLGDKVQNNPMEKVDTIVSCEGGIKVNVDHEITEEESLKTDEICEGDKFQKISVEIPTAEVLSSNEDESGEGSIHDLRESVKDKEESFKEDDINDNMSECSIEQEIESYSDESDTESEADDAEEVVDSEDEECFIPRSTSYWNIHEEHSDENDLSAAEELDDDVEYDSEFHSETDSDSDDESEDEKECDQDEPDSHHDDTEKINVDNESGSCADSGDRNSESEAAEVCDELQKDADLSDVASDAEEGNQDQPDFHEMENIDEHSNKSEAELATGTDSESESEVSESIEVPAVETVDEPDIPEVESVSRHDSEDSASEAEAVDGDDRAEISVNEIVNKTEIEGDSASECSDAEFDDEENQSPVPENKKSTAPQDAKDVFNDSDSKSDDDGIIPTKSSLNMHQQESEDLQQSSDGSDCGDFEPDDEKFNELMNIQENLQKDDPAQDSNDSDCCEFEPDDDKFNELTASVNFDFDQRFSQQQDSDSDSDSSDYDYDYGGYKPSTMEMANAPCSIIVVSDSDPNIPKPKSILRLVSKYEMNQNGESFEESMNLPKKRISFRAIEAEYRFIDPIIRESDTSRDSFLYESIKANMNSSPCDDDSDLDDDFDLTFANQDLDQSDSLDMIPDEEEEIAPISAKDIFGDLPPLEGTKEASPPSSQKGSSSSLLGDLPTLSPKTSNSNLLGDLPLLSPKTSNSTLLGDLPTLTSKSSSSASFLGNLPSLSPNPSKDTPDEGHTNNSLLKSNSNFSFTAGGGGDDFDDDESIADECIEEEIFSDFEEDEEEFTPKNNPVLDKNVGSTSVDKSAEQDKPLAMVHDKDITGKNISAKIKTPNGVTNKTSVEDLPPLSTKTSNSINAKDIFGDLPPLGAKKSSLPPLSPKGSTSSLLGGLPPLSPKNSRSSLVGDLPSQSPKSSTSLLGELPSLSPSSSKNNFEEKTDRIFANSRSNFSFSVDRGEESHEAENVVEEEIEEEVMSDFEDEDIALILENL